MPRQRTGYAASGRYFWSVLLPRRPLLFLLLPIWAALSCSTPEPQRPRNSRYGGMLNLNETEELRSIHPLNLTQASARRIAGQIYEGLVRLDPQDLSIQPALAESWEESTDGTTWTFHLRPGVRFHDDPVFPDGRGRELQADDVVRCFNSICTQGEGDLAFRLFQGLVEGADARYTASGNGRSGVEPLSGVTRIDNRTVQIRLTHREPSFLMILTDPGCWIHPQELTARYGPDPLGHAIGTGPFRLHSATAGEVIVLERHAHYWDRDSLGAPLPYLDGIRVTFDPDKVSESRQFLLGNLTLMDEPLAPVDVDTSGRPAPIELSMPSLSVQYLGFNSIRPPFKDPRIRRAIAMVIDRKFLVDSVMLGSGVTADHGLVPPGISGYPYALVPTMSYHPDSARALLTKAGYPGGRGLPPLLLQVNNDGYRYVAVAEAVQDMVLEQLGVPVVVSVLPARQHYARIEAGGAPLWRGGWIADFPDPENFLYRYHGRYAVTDPTRNSGINTTRYANIVFDRLFDKAAASTSAEDRMLALAQAEAVLMHDLPALPLYHERAVLTLQPYVRGIHLNPMEHLDLSRAWFDPATRPVR